MSWQLVREINRDCDNRFLQAARDNGDRVLGYTCSFVPDALLDVAGLRSMRVFAPGGGSTEMGDVYLSNVLCSYTRNVLQYALEDRYPHVDGWVFTSSCDHLRRLYDNLIYLTKPAFSFILDLPHKSGPEATAWYTEQVRALARRLEEHFQVDLGPQAIFAAVEARNRVYAELRAIGALRRRPDPPLSGADYHALVRAAAVVPPADLLALLAPIRKELEAKPGLKKKRARLMVVGSELDDPRYLETVESTGALVVADRYCTGSIPGIDPVLVGDSDPLADLAAFKLQRTPCPRMMEDFNVRKLQILRAVEEYKVDGVIVETMKFCDLWNIESQPLRKALKEAGIPELRVEREYVTSGEGQLRTRVQAFLESMGR